MSYGATGPVVADLAEQGCGFSNLGVKYRLSELVKVKVKREKGGKKKCQNIKIENSK